MEKTRRHYWVAVMRTTVSLSRSAVDARGTIGTIAQLLGAGAIVGGIALKSPLLGFTGLVLAVGEGTYHVWKDTADRLSEMQDKATAGQLVVRSGGRRMLEFENVSDTEIYDADWEWVGDGLGRAVNNGGFPIPTMPSHATVSASYVDAGWSILPGAIRTKWKDANGIEHSQDWPRGMWH